MNASSLEKLLDKIEGGESTIPGFGAKSKSREMLRRVVNPDADAIEYLEANDGFEVTAPSSSG